MIGLAFAALFFSAPDRVTLRVTVYDRSELDAQTREDLLQRTSHILRAAGISVTWVDGDLSASEAALLQAPEPARPGRELEAACRARRDIALDLLDSGPDEIRRAILGMAVPLASEGLNVRLFVGRVAGAASRERISFSVFAAHTLAHEIGHVLLRTEKHARVGLMAGAWGGHEYDRMKDGVLAFSAAESFSMRKTLSGNACSSFDATARRLPLEAEWPRPD